MPLYVFYTMVQKSQKWLKTQIKGGPALSASGSVFVFIAAHKHSTKVQYGSQSNSYVVHGDEETLFVDFLG